jgi:hypothetical protein
MSQVAGDWRLIYTTLQILGNKRTKLGLRTFVNLGDFVQRIDLESKQAVNNVAFNVVGLGSLEGESASIYFIITAVRCFEQILPNV